MSSPAPAPEHQTHPIVVSLAEAPAKPLFKDSARLMAVSAFIFSLVTGLYATYQTYQNDRDANVERVTKLIDDYFDKQETLSHLDRNTQLAYITLIQSQIRAIAERAVYYANKVQDDLSDGSWQSLAQVSNAEGNFSGAIEAWRQSTLRTRDARLYLFGLQSLGLTQLHANDPVGARATFTRLLADLYVTRPEGSYIENNGSKFSRDLFASETYILWLQALNSKDCSVTKDLYKSAVAALASAEAQSATTTNPYDTQNLDRQKSMVDKAGSFFAKCLS